MLVPAVEDDRSALQRWIDELGAETFSALWQSFPLEVREAYAYDWSKIARPKQLPPPGDWLLWMVRAGRGFGKALALDTPLPTPAGWTTMGEVQVGDLLFDENGLPCRVTYATEIQLGRHCFEVEFDDGSVIVADGDHLWLTWTKAARKAHGRASRPTIHPAVVTTTQVRDTLRVQGGREVNHSVAVSGCLKLPPADLPIDPYVLGVWLGDGDNKAATVTTGDDEQWRLLEKAGAKVGTIVFDPRTNAQRATVGGSPAARGLNGRMVSNGSLHSKLRKLGLMNNKHVPEAYLRADPGQRLAILQGLMDTDGSCSTKGNVEFCTTRQELAHGVLELALGLGMKAVIYGGRATLRGKDCGPKYRVCWTPHVPMFRLSRKLARQHGGKGQRTRTHHRYIVGVRLVPTVPVRCIQVDSPSHLFLAGRTMIPTHNTRTGAEWIRMGVESGACGRVALIGPTAADTRDVMVEGTSGILAISPNHWRPQYEPSKRRLTWPNGAVGTLYSAEEPDRLRGPQHDRAWADELAAWAQLEETWDMMQFGLRLGDHPQALVTTTPRGLPFLRKLENDPTTVVTRGNTYENAGNLAPSFLAAIKKKYEGTRLGRQEIDAEILDDNPGALWKRAMIDGHRVERAPQLSRIIIPWDPAVTSDATSDEHGILAVGAGMCTCKGEPELHGFVIEDGSAILTPSESCDRVASLYQRRMANGVIGETNQGGDFIEALLRANPKSKGLTYRGVHAKDGKRLRAEPVVALYEQGKVHHVGMFPKLEDEMTQWDPMNQVESPNRVDALVHGLTELLVHPAPPSYSSSRGSGPKFRV